MATPEFQAMMEVFAQQMQQQQLAIQAAVQTMQQQQVTIQAMLSHDRGHQPHQKIDEKFYKKVESFSGEQNWRDWSFHFKSATKMADESAYQLLDWAEKEESDIDDDLMKDTDKITSSAIFNVLGTLVKGEPLQMLHTSGC